MLVVCAIRADYLLKPGGDTVQFNKTVEYIKKRHNVQIEICTLATEVEQLYKITKIDLIHIFNIQTISETRQFFNIASKLNIPICFSPIYWNLFMSVFSIQLFEIFRIFNWGGSGYYFLLKLIHWMKPLIIRSLSFIKGEKFYSKTYIKYGNDFLRNSTFVLPNSLEEAEILKSTFEAYNNNYLPIPNGVDIQRFLGGDSKENREGVIQVGRIEVNKNQLIVLLALWSRKDVVITFVGRVGDGLCNRYYYKILARLAKTRGNVHFLDEVSHDDLAAIYQRACVHVLPSLRESPGLVTLEALASGCRIVVSGAEYCPVRFYEFDKYAYICNPLSKKSVRTQICKALASSKPKPDNDYWSKFSYEYISDNTFKVYSAMCKID